MLLRRYDTAGLKCGDLRGEGLAEHRAAVEVLHTLQLRQVLGPDAATPPTAPHDTARTP